MGKSIVIGALGVNSHGPYRLMRFGHDGSPVAVISWFPGRDSSAGVTQFNHFDLTYRAAMRLIAQEMRNPVVYAVYVRDCDDLLVWRSGGDVVLYDGAGFFDDLKKYLPSV